ncbi:MAG: 2OG-Fe(II) oxygenase [Acidimicrobiales bacterium]
MELTDELLDIEVLERSSASIAARYQAAAPFPHVVLDGVLRPDAVERAYGEFEAADPEAWTNYIHVNERKFATRDSSTWGPALREVAGSLMSDRFVSFLRRVTGFEQLVPDATMDGGGLHRSLAGGYLNVHADFTAHHAQRTWHRRVNVLLYLNRVWQPCWGGNLELWATDMSRCVQSIAPLGNRLVIFTTSETSYHGHPEPMTCPDDVARQSLALYYFTEEPNPPTHATNYRPRPTDGRASAAAIYADNQAVHLHDVMKRRFRVSDEAVGRWLGRVSRVRRPRP